MSAQSSVVQGLQQVREGQDCVCVCLCFEHVWHSLPSPRLRAVFVASFLLVPRMARDFTEYVDVASLDDRIGELVEQAVARAREPQTRALEQRIETVVANAIELHIEMAVTRAVERAPERVVTQTVEGRTAEHPPSYRGCSSSGPSVASPWPSKPFKKTYVNSRSECYHHAECCHVSQRSDELRPCDKRRKLFGT